VQTAPASTWPSSTGAGQPDSPSVRQGGDRRCSRPAWLSGAFMTVRQPVDWRSPDAFAPVSGGDPMAGRATARRWPATAAMPGVARDLETGRTISEPAPAAVPTWLTKGLGHQPGGAKSAFRQFHHEGDAILDVSCVEKVATQLTARVSADAGSDAARRHRLALLADEYNTPLLAFFPVYPLSTRRVDPLCPVTPGSRDEQALPHLSHHLTLSAARSRWRPTRRPAGAKPKRPARRATAPTGSVSATRFPTWRARSRVISRPSWPP
jgi:hypothetical protein